MLFHITKITDCCLVIKTAYFEILLIVILSNERKFCLIYHEVNYSRQHLLKMYIWYKCHYINIREVKHQIVYLITSTYIQR